MNIWKKDEFLLLSTELPLRVNRFKWRHWSIEGVLRPGNYLMPMLMQPYIGCWSSNNNNDCQCYSCTYPNDPWLVKWDTCDKRQWLQRLRESDVEPCTAIDRLTILIGDDASVPARIRKCNVMDYQLTRINVTTGTTLHNKNETA